MSLLHDIQSAVLDEKSDLAPILLKLRLLAARLGSQPLAEWVKYESEGYSKDVPVPDYRIIPVSYTASFSGPFGSGIRNAQIAPYLIEKFAGKQWTRYEIRESIAAVDELLASSSKSGSPGIDAADLVLLLQGKVYADYACNEVTGTISRSSLAELRHSVRSRVLELTIELEKSVPEVETIVLGKGDKTSPSSSAIATQISQQIIYGNVTSISASGNGSQVNIAIGERDLQGLVEFLKRAGIPETDAQQLGEIVATEEPESKQEPLGRKATKWFVDNLKKAADGTWKIGVSVATDVIKEAILKYYGLK
jgi:hypothetical protein